MTSNMTRVIARDYVRACHDPYHPSYRAFVAQVQEQYRDLIYNGWKFILTDHTQFSTAYETSAAMFEDMQHKRLRIYTGGSDFGYGHPLAVGDSGWSNNTLFRAVHDVLGHGTTTCPFETMDGEIEAYHNHLKYFSPLAIPALFSETIGQLAYYFTYGGFVPRQDAKIIKVRNI